MPKKYFTILLSVIISVGLVFTYLHAQTENLIKLHKNAVSNASLCVQCHGDRTDEKSLKEGIPSIHTTHLTKLKKMLEGKGGCTFCHKSVDLQEGSAANIRKQVDVKTTCMKCHSNKFHLGGAK